MKELGLDLDELIEHEEEPGSATAARTAAPASWIRSRPRHPAIGHGIRYEFASSIRRSATAVRSRRRHVGCLASPGDPALRIEHVVGFGGRTEQTVDEKGIRRARWIPSAS